MMRFSRPWRGLPPWVWLALLAALVLQYIAAAHTELSFDEAYYWLWSQNLQLSYYDHPPFIAWMIALSTKLFGDGEWAVRFFSPLMLFFMGVMLAGATRDLGGGERAQVIAALFLPATVLGNALFITTPDTPLLFFATATLRALTWFYQTQNGKAWLIIGATVGLAMLSKYTALMLPVGIALWLMSSPRLRQELRKPQLWFGTLIVAALFMPVLVWNTQHGFASFLKQGGRFDVGSVLQRFMVLDFLGAQALLVTPLLFLLICYAIYRHANQARRGESRAVLLCALSLPLLLLVLALSCLRKVEANWASSSFPPLAVMAALTAEKEWSRLRRFVQVAFGCGALLSLTLMLYLLLPWQNKFGRIDMTQRLSGHRQVADELMNLADKRDICLVVTEHYAINALFTYYLRDRLPVAQVTQPERYIGWQQRQDCKDRMIFVVAAQGNKIAEKDFLLRYGALIPVANLQRRHRGVAVQTYELWQARLASGP